MLKKENQIKERNKKSYLNLAISGGIANSLTHTIFTPIDLVKCKRQSGPKAEKLLNLSVLKTWKIIYKKNGILELFRGWQPTAIGYGIQGIFKFGIYEKFKDLLLEYKINENLSYITSGTLAEAIGSVALCPFENIKVEVQTSKALPPGIVDGLIRTRRRYYRSLFPLWGRQIPYTACKFLFFEKSLEKIHSKFNLGNPKNDGKINLPATFGAGYISGISCAIISHPADVLVSHIGSAGARNISFQQAIKELPFSAYWAGLGPRIFMVGSLTALQWLSYNSIKKFLDEPNI